MSFYAVHISAFDATKKLKASRGLNPRPHLGGLQLPSPPRDLQLKILQRQYAPLLVLPKLRKKFNLLIKKR